MTCSRCGSKTNLPFGRAGMLSSSFKKHNPKKEAALSKTASFLLLRIDLYLYTGIVRPKGYPISVGEAVEGHFHRNGDTCL